MARVFQKRYKVKQGILGSISGTYEFLQITKNGVIKFVKKRSVTSGIR